MIVAQLGIENGRLCVYYNPRHYTALTIGNALIQAGRDLQQGRKLPHEMEAP